MANVIKTVYTYPLDGYTTDFTIPFEYLARKFVAVTLIGQDRKELTVVTDYRFATRTTISLTRAWGPADNYQQIEIRRYTSATERLVDFSDGSILRAHDLNVAQVQTLHVAEEARDLTADTIGVNNDGNLDARGRRIINVADGKYPGDAITLGQVTAWNDSALNSKNAAKVSENNAKTSETNVKTSENNAKTSERNAKIYSENAKASEQSVLVSVGDAAASASAAAGSVKAATNSAGTAKTEADRAKTEADRLEDFNDLTDRINSVAVAEVGEVCWHQLRSKMKVGCVPADGQLVANTTAPDLRKRIEDGLEPVVDEALWQSDLDSRGSYTLYSSTHFRVPDHNGSTAGGRYAPVLRGDSGDATLSGKRNPTRVPNIKARIEGYSLIGHTQGDGVPFRVTRGDVNAYGKVAAPDSWGSALEINFANSSNVYKDGATEAAPAGSFGCWVIRIFGVVNNPGAIDAAAIATRTGALESSMSVVKDDLMYPKIMTLSAAVTAGYLSVTSGWLANFLKESFIEIYKDRYVLRGRIQLSDNIELPNNTAYTILKAPTGKTKWTRTYSQISLADLWITGVLQASGAEFSGVSAYGTGTIGTDAMVNFWTTNGSGPVTTAITFADVWYFTS